MRFRLANNASQSPVDGIGRGMQTLFSMPMLEAQAAEEFQNGEQKRQLTQSTMAAHAAQAREADAHTALYGQQAAEKQQLIERGGLGETIQTAALINKLPLSQAREFSQYAQTGQLPPLYNTPGDGNGPSVPKPSYTDPQVGDRIMQTLGLLRGGLTMGGHDIADVTKAGGQLQQQDNIRGVIADPSSAGRVGQAYAAVDGKPLVDAIGNTGRGFNKFTGDGNTLAPGVAALYDQDQQAQIGQRNAAAGASQASAASSYASAEHSRAGTAKTRAETDQLVNGPKGVLVQTDAGPVFSDPRTGSSVAVRNADGSPAAPKLKDIPAAQNHAFIENAKSLQNIDSAMQAITKATGISLDADGNPVRAANVKPTAPDALGARNYLGDGIRQRTDPNGVNVRAQVANIAGQRFHDVSGAAVSVGEAKRLQPFIPQATDGPGAALQKLQNMRREYQNVNEMLQQTYSRDQGFKPSVAARTGAQPGADASSGGRVIDFNTLGTNVAPAGNVIDFGGLR